MSRLLRSLAGACLLATLARSSAIAAADARSGLYQPAAAAAAEIVDGHARFTVLTPSLIRMEWSADGRFEDRASFAFLNRALRVPHLQVEKQPGRLVIRTAELVLTYSGAGARFDPADLAVVLNATGTQWRPGQNGAGNLGGTARTLDQERGETLRSPFGQGLLSRDGWALIDDTQDPLFDTVDFRFGAGERSPWPWFRLRPPGERQDWYFFGYGHRYRAALRDFRTVSGPVPLPPPWAFGSMWTRYWPYTDRDLLDLVDEFRRNSVPLDALVIDMDWHLTQFQLERRGAHDQSEMQSLGWDGTSWNRSLFPDPKAFLDDLHRDGLHVSLNVHPANGVQIWEDQYADMARAMGQDPADQHYVPFRILDRTFAQASLDTLYHPLERQGVDFWWLDWQQVDRYLTPGIDSTFWLNYVHFTDQQREGRRPLLFGRWGGLGNHRYPMGFSGDVITSWDSLRFQPGFTATAANVAFAYWNHDIGGHIPGPIDPELYTRWIQWGAFSPAMRTHTAPSVYADRRIWSYPEPYSRIMRAAFDTRYALMPYIYTEARRTYDTGIAFLHPLYYEWPERDAAYRYPDEYMFGDSIVAAPVVEPSDALTGLVHQRIWIPDGVWIELESGRTFHGPAEITRAAGLDEIPLFTRPGAILPEAVPGQRMDVAPVDPLVLRIAPFETPGTTTYRLYADNGEGEDYQTGQRSWTDLSATRSGSDTTIRISAEAGRYRGMPTRRAYQVELPGDWPPIAVRVNGRAIHFRAFGNGEGWHYDGTKLMTVIRVGFLAVGRPVGIVARRDPALEAERWKLDGLAGAVEDLRATELALTDQVPVEHAPESLAAAAEFAVRVTYHPETVAREVDAELACLGVVQRDVADAIRLDPAILRRTVLRAVPDEHAQAFGTREAEYRNRNDRVAALLARAVQDMPHR